MEVNVRKRIGFNKQLYQVYPGTKARRRLPWAGVRPWDTVKTIGQFIKSILGEIESAAWYLPLLPSSNTAKFHPCEIETIS